MTDRVAMARALEMMESSGRGKSKTSVDGSVGGMQIQPKTFAAFADPGMDIKNPDHNYAVAARLINHLADISSEDPLRVAVGYFSGEGNIAPPNSPTPWKKDSVDGNGTRTSQYVAKFLQHLAGGTGGDTLVRVPKVEDDWEIVDTSSKTPTSSVGDSGSSDWEIVPSSPSLGLPPDSITPTIHDPILSTGDLKPTPDETSFLERVATGIGDTGLGVAQLNLNLQDRLLKALKSAVGIEAPWLTSGSDSINAAMKKREQEYQNKRGTEGAGDFDWGRLLGKAVPYAATPQGVFPSFVAGTVYGATEPQTSGEYSLGKAGVQGVLSGLTSAIPTALGKGGGKLFNLDRSAAQHGQDIALDALKLPGKTARESLDAVQQAYAEVPELAIGETTPRGVSTLGSLARRSGTTWQSLVDTLPSRSRDAGDRISKSAAELLDVPTLMSDAKAYNKATKLAADPDYKAAYAKPVEVTPALEELLQRPSMKRALIHAANLVEDEGQIGMGKEIRNLISGKGVVTETPTMEMWDWAKRGLDDVINKGYKGQLGAKGNPKGAKEIREALLTELDKQVPEYGVARSKWSGAQRLDEVMSEGERFLTRKPEEVKDYFNSLNDSEKVAYRTGATSAISFAANKNKLRGAAVTGQIAPSKNLRQKLLVIAPDEARAMQLEQKLSTEELLYENMRSMVGPAAALGRDELEGTLSQNLSRVAVNTLGAANNNPYSWGRLAVTLSDMARTGTSLKARNEAGRILAAMHPEEKKQLMDQLLNRLSEREKTRFMQPSTLSGLAPMALGNMAVRQPVPQE